jgi:hypothetical protein
VISSFLIIFQFSKYFFDNQIYSLLSVLLLEGAYFFNYTTPELNGFIALLPFIALTALFCWKAIIYNNSFDWIMFGVFAGISTLTWYLALYLLASIGIFFIREIMMPIDNELEQQSLPLLSKVNGEALLKTTPMFQQFLEIKSDNLDSLLFF